MALINCLNCSGMVSTKAPACPHCGAVPFVHTSEKENLEKHADDFGSISEAGAHLERFSPIQLESSPPNPSPLLQTEGVASSDNEKPKRQYTTGDLILYSILWTAVLALFVPALFMLIGSYFEKPDSTSHQVPVTNGTYTPKGNWQLKEFSPPVR